MRGINREIKFKGYCRLIPELTGWYFGNFIEEFPPSYEECHELLCGRCDIGEKTGRHTSHVVARDSICQYTGFKDDDGNEIYEGDIILGTWQNEKTIELVGWNSERACFGIKLVGVKYNDKPKWSLNKLDYQFDFDNEQLCGLVHKRFHGINRIAVIGNKFSNPELLEDKDALQKYTEEG